MLVQAKHETGRSEALVKTGDYPRIVTTEKPADGKKDRPAIGDYPPVVVTETDGGLQLTSDCQEKLAEAKAEIANLKRRLERSNQTLEPIKARLEHYQKAAEAAQQDLKKFADSADNYGETISSLRQENQKLRIQVSSLQENQTTETRYVRVPAASSEAESYREAMRSIADFEDNEAVAALMQRIEGVKKAIEDGKDAKTILNETKTSL